MKNISSSWMCLVLILLTGTAVHAQFTIDHQVTIRPIRISDGTTTMGPSSDSSLRTAFGDAANKIWAQAGLDIYFLPLETVTSSTFYNVTSGTGINSISSLSSAGG